MRNKLVTTILATLLFCSPFTIASGKLSTLTQRPAASFDRLKQNFNQPDMIYAPFAFWFWDAPPDANTAALMAEQMCRQRLNPGYAHARIGLPDKDWLSDKWFEAYGKALAKTEAAGMYMGYCDEYMWPSGQAGGRVLAENPHLRAVLLKWTVSDVSGNATIELPESFFTMAAQRIKPDTAVLNEPHPKFGKWLWHSQSLNTKGEVYFCRIFKPKQNTKISAASLIITVDDSYTLYMNDRKLADGIGWNKPTTYNLLPFIVAGENNIAVKAVNDGAQGGMLSGLMIKYQDGSIEQIPSDEKWLVSKESIANWTRGDFNDADWSAAWVIGDAQVEPWRMTTETAHVPAKIKSDTLARIGGGKPFSWSVPAGEWRIYSFYKFNHPGIYGSNINYLDRRLPAAFIDIVHKPYAERFGKQIGKSIVGVFVDNEGDYGYKLTWSDDLDKEYKQTKGGDIRQLMPLLIDEDIEGRWPKARWDWYDVVSDIYSDNYLGAISRWLGKQGMYDISNLWEEELVLQAFAVGDFFKAQRAVTMPGNDCLFEKALLVHDFKETQSVSEFENKRFMSEILGVAGWQMKPVLMKQAVNAVTAWGVSHIVPHGINSNRNLNTIPYPADWFMSNPYWQYLHLWTDFARRSCYINSYGQTVPDVLLINPMDSIWSLYGGGIFDTARIGGDPVLTGYAPIIAEIEKVYTNAIKELTANRIEYLIADRYYIRQMTVSKKGTLVRGRFEFKAIVLPSMLILPLDIAEKITAFAKSGGYVYVLGNLPQWSTDNGIDDPKMKSLMDKLISLPTVKKAEQGISAIASQNAPFMASTVKFESGEFEMIQLHRRIDGRDFYWLANNTGDVHQCAMFFTGAKGFASIWDCETGSIAALASQQTDSGSRVELVFKPYQAYWAVFDPNDKPVTEKPTGKTEITKITIDRPWNIHIDLDVQPPPAAPRLVAPYALLADGGDVRKLASWLDWGLDRFSGFVDYTTSFKIDANEPQLILDLGKVKYMAEVWVNDVPVGCRLWPPFEFDITKAVKSGENKLLVRIGNLLCNTMKQYQDNGSMPETWERREITTDDLDAGLFGPVTIKAIRTSGER